MFSSEAGAFIGGHGMKTDNQMATLAQYSNLHDAEPVKIFRRGDGDIRVVDKRLNLLLFGQWPVVRDFFSNSLNRGQGFLSRLLICYPKSLIGSRPLVMDASDAIAVMDQYSAWMLDLLNLPLPLKEGTLNELDPPALELSSNAIPLFKGFYEEVEQLMGKLGPDNAKLNLVNKFAQMALRLAATMQVAENPAARTLDAEHVERGIKLARYFMDEAQRLSSTAPAAENLEAAKMLLDFLRERRLVEVNLTWLGKNGPHSLRAKRAYKPVIDFLVDYGWMVTVTLPKTLGVAKAKTVFRLTTAALRELGMRAR
jgi:hypothetical protein